MGADLERGEGMTTRAEIIRKAKEILLEDIRYAEIKSDTDAYSLALRTLVDYAMEWENKI